MYVTDSGNNRIRKVDATGTITTIAGTGEYGFSGDGGPAVQAALSYPEGVAVDGAGNRVRHGFRQQSHSQRSMPRGRSPPSPAWESTASAATAARQSRLLWTTPRGVAVDGAGNLYIADTVNDRIRKVDSAGVITTVAGTGDYGDGGPAVQAQLNGPRGVAVDGAGNVYIADTGNFLVRKLTPVGRLRNLTRRDRIVFISGSRGMVDHKQRNGRDCEGWLRAYQCRRRFDHSFRDRHFPIQGQPRSTHCRSECPCNRAYPGGPDICRSRRSGQYWIGDRQSKRRDGNHPTSISRTPMASSLG